MAKFMACSQFNSHTIDISPLVWMLLLSTVGSRKLSGKFITYHIVYQYSLCVSMSYANPKFISSQIFVNQN